MMQLSVIDALSVMVQALSINSVDATKLAALVQNSRTSKDVDDIVSLPALPSWRLWRTEIQRRVAECKKPARLRR